MKKYLVFLLVILLSCGISGCGAQTLSQFDPLTNSHETMQELDFQVPKEWQNSYDGPDYREYFQMSSEGDMENGFSVTWIDELNENEIPDFTAQMRNQTEDSFHPNG